MNSKVSIIIPIYNAEKNLERCIESVLKQDYGDFELLLIDDGSTDSSGRICDEYSKKDDRIQVVHKENSGVSDSRNTGISLAKGEYIQFIDSDDWITPEATGLMVRRAEEHNCDMVISDFYRVVSERVSHKGDIQEEGILTKTEFAAYMMEKPADFYYGVLWNKLYRREIIEKHDLCMDKEISWCEDFMFNLEYIRYVDNVYVSRVPVYYYVKTKGSLVNHGIGMSKVIQMKKNVFQHYNAFYRDIFNEDDYEKNRMHVYRFLLDAAEDGIVPPTILPGTFKLGKERTSIRIDAIEGEGMLLDLFLERKLLDRHLEIIAIRNDLTLVDVKFILYISQSYKNFDLKESAEVLNVSKRDIRFSTLKLENKEMIKVTEYRNKADSEERETGRQIEIELLPAAEAILNEVLEESSRVEQIKLMGFTEEEMEQYVILSEKVKENIRNALK